MYNISFLCSPPPKRSCPVLPKYRSFLQGPPLFSFCSKSFLFTAKGLNMMVCVYIKTPPLLYLVGILLNHYYSNATMGYVSLMQIGKY